MLSILKQTNKQLEQQRYQIVVSAPASGVIFNIVAERATHLLDMRIDK